MFIITDEEKLQILKIKNLKLAEKLWLQLGDNQNSVFDSYW